MTEKSTVNVNVKTTLLKQIRNDDSEFADMPATHIIEFILRTWIKRKDITYSVEPRARRGT